MARTHLVIDIEQTASWWEIRAHQSKIWDLIFGIYPSKKSVKTKVQMEQEMSSFPPSNDCVYSLLASAVV